MEMSLNMNGHLNNAKPEQDGHLNMAILQVVCSSNDKTEGAVVVVDLVEHVTHWYRTDLTVMRMERGPNYHVPCGKRADICYNRDWCLIIWNNHPRVRSREQREATREGPDDDVIPHLNQRCVKSGHLHYGLLDDQHSGNPKGKKERNGSKKGGFECFFRAKVAGDIPGGLKSEDGYRQAIKREGVTTHADCNR
ncbi:hypothetical protein CEXT_386051 [Caerostris extrusa]|uniref:Uncharacterized protein n=1 Tax=Caerostris extrusa TaxID=172846 RepID=A0AAV4RT66_CAEEX|nr:hypothetical protein CEXT_386051 [Caerostris extrusa]